MKKIFLLTLIACFLSSLGVYSQNDKSKRVSHPAKVSETISSGATITINYSKPSAKGRFIGKEVAHFGKVWRTGANEATVFEVDKNIMVNGKKLPAGKYSLYTIPGQKAWTIIFNKTWDQWGTVYSVAEDALRVTSKPIKTVNSTEQLTFKIAKNGLVSLLWTNTKVDFKVQ